MGAGDTMGTVEKGVEVLFHLHGAPAPCGVTAIGKALDIPKSSVHRLLGALARRGLVERDDRGLYRPGVGLVALGLGVLEREPVVAAARPVLESSAEQIGETFFLVSARAGSLVVLDKAEGTGFLRAAPRVGAKVPVHATAVGKLYLAFAPEQLEDDEAAYNELYTSRTLAGRASLEEAVEQVRREGVASNLDEWVPGLSVWGAPIWLGDRLVAALALALPSTRLPELGDERLTASVLEAAGKIGARLQGAV